MMSEIYVTKLTFRWQPEEFFFPWWWATITETLLGKIFNKLAAQQGWPEISCPLWITNQLNMFPFCSCFHFTNISSRPGTEVWYDIFFMLNDGVFHKFYEKKKNEKHTCCVFELHSMYATAPIWFFSSSPWY